MNLGALPSVFEGGAFGRRGQTGGFPYPEIIAQIKMSASFLAARVAADMPAGQHALMQKARDQDGATLPAVKHHVQAMLQTSQARTNLITAPA